MELPLYGPVIWILECLGTSDNGCHPRGCSAYTLTTKEMCRMFGQKRQRCRMIQTPTWNLCLTHCNPVSRTNVHTLLRHINSSMFNRHTFSRADNIHAHSRQDALWLQSFFQVRRTCCGRKGFYPSSWRVDTSLRLKTTRPLWRTHIPKPQRIRLVRQLWWYLLARTEPRNSITKR